VRFSLCDSIRKEERGWNVLSGMVFSIFILHSNCHSRVSPERVDQLRNSIILLFPWSQVDDEAADARGAEGNAMGGGAGARGAEGIAMEATDARVAERNEIAMAAWKLDRRRIYTRMAASTQANPRRWWK
jgi:hypothetical protein